MFNENSLESYKGITKKLKFVESKTQELLMNDYYNSFGFGTNISMTNGVLTLIYGLGRKIGNPFLIRTGKIHLGFTSYF